MKKKTINGIEIFEWSVGDQALTGSNGFSQGLVSAIGNFDGVHRGHQTLINSALVDAEKNALLPSVITFEPHPREFFRRDETTFRLVDKLEKERLIANLLQKARSAKIINIEFNDALRRTDATAFVRDVLANLGVRRLFAGKDFAFGKGRGGDLDMINREGKLSGISATPVELLTDENTSVISSSRIRAALQAGSPASAASMLGRNWAVCGEVIKGSERGRTIGFPTANIRLGTLQHPAFGVYAVEIELDNGNINPDVLGVGVANIGIRPTVEHRGVLCEVHLFDRDIDLYSKRLLVRLREFLRPERKFSGIEELTSQIKKDSMAARRIFSKIVLARPDLR